MVLTVLLMGTMPQPAQAASWEPVTKDLIRTEKPGYGKLCGVVVDHATGDVYVDLSEKGLYRSTDKGHSWKRIGSPAIKGRTEWPGCLLFDPLGKSNRMVLATVYGGPVAISPDRGATWKLLDKKSRHVDWCVVDWSDRDMRFVLALAHEQNGLLLASRDGGKSFKEVGKGFGPGWIFDRDTAVIARMKSKENAKAHLLRTSDGAKSFQSCGDYRTSALPKWHDGVLYWLVDGALITTRDKGKTWRKQSDLKGGQYGPIFGKDAKHLFVLTAKGAVESVDGGASWGKPIPLPKDVRGALTWLEYDPKNDLIYVMSMGTELYQRARSR
jgi:photosystem II stability/assembly factor-like uncharacterized protein